MSILNRSRAGATVDVGALLDAGAVEYAVSIISAGALLSLYRTRDGGALGCTIVFDGDTEKDYFRSTEELCEFLREVDEALTARPAAPSSAKGRRKGA